jgi:hypothetical protein
MEIYTMENTDGRGKASQIIEVLQNDLIKRPGSHLKIGGMQ